MKGTSLVFVVAFVVLAVLHQDNWNWDRADLVLGFLPVGLAYHAGYSLVAAIFWAVVVRFGWPDRLEAWAEESEEKEETGGGER